MSQQTMILGHIREQGIQGLGERLGIVGMVRFLQQSETVWGNYTEDRHHWLGDPDIRTVAQAIQCQYPGQETDQDTEAG